MRIECKMKDLQEEIAKAFPRIVSDSALRRGSDCDDVQEQDETDIMENILDPFDVLHKKLQRNRGSAPVQWGS